MSSASAPCRECDRSSYQCEGCRQSFCRTHLSQHRENLNQQFHNLTTEYSNLQQILSLPPSYESLTENTELVNKINQWEIDSIRQVKELAETAREKLRSRSDVIPTERFRPELQQFNDELQGIQQANNLIESDIQRLISKFKDLKFKIEDSIMTTLDIKITPIDWTKYFQLITKPNSKQRPQQVLHFDRLSTSTPRINLDVRGADWYVLGVSSSTNPKFLLYQHTKKNKRLSIVNSDGQQRFIPWYDDQSIWDCCWSSLLNKFLILADNRLYTYDDEISTTDSMQLVESIRPRREKMEFLRCTCLNETFFITYDERNSSVDEYNLIQWTTVHRYENVVKQNEIIIGIAVSAMNSNLIGMTILDDRQNWHFELRDRSMLLVSSVKLDRSEFNRRLLTLPNSLTNWVVVHTGSSFFTVIDENAQRKETIECAENIDLATYFPTNNCLVVLTQKSKLKFFDL